MHEDVKQHKAKAGTPTMGGVVFLITAVLVSFVVTVLTGNFTRPCSTDSIYLDSIWNCWILDDFKSLS